MRYLALFFSAALCSAAHAEDFAREQMRIVGSSTVYPFVAASAEQFGRGTDFRTPIVEATGTGGGINLFCSGVGADTADMANASRQIKEKEVTLCHKNGVTDVLGIAIGYDGIVLANKLGETHWKLSIKQLFMALAKRIPKGNKLIENPHITWHDVDPSLPKIKIEVYGPPPTSGTRDAFVELVMEEACKNLPAFKTAYPDSSTRKAQCHLLREDGAYVDAGENDNIIVQKLVNNASALGIFGYSFLEQNADKVQAARIDNIMPSFENIVSGKYEISRSLFVYIKTQHKDLVPGMREFLEELMSENAASEDGYLTAKGLIPLTAAERKANLEKIRAALN